MKWVNERKILKYKYSLWTIASGIRAEWYKSVGKGTQGWLKQRWAGKPIHRQSLAMNPDMSGQLHDGKNMGMRMICFMSDVRGNQRPDKNMFPGRLLPHPMIT